jgi:hypothetical protein
VILLELADLGLSVLAEKLLEVVLERGHHRAGLQQQEDQLGQLQS